MDVFYDCIEMILFNGIDWKIVYEGFELNYVFGLCYYGNYFFWIEYWSGSVYCLEWGVGGVFFIVIFLCSEWFFIFEI